MYIGRSRRVGHTYIFRKNVRLRCRHTCICCGNLFRAICGPFISVNPSTHYCKLNECYNIKTSLLTYQTWDWRVYKSLISLLLIFFLNTLITIIYSSVKKKNKKYVNSEEYTGYISLTVLVTSRNSR